MGISYADVIAGNYDPPAMCARMGYVWDSTQRSPKQMRLRGIYKDLVTDADYPAGYVNAYFTPGALIAMYQAELDRTAYPNEMWSVDLPDAEAFTFAALKITHNGDVDDDPLGVKNPGVPSGNPNTDDKTLSIALYAAMIRVHHKWCAYLTRCKVTMARMTQFAYAPSVVEDADISNDDMSYSTMSSWYRVNRFTRRIGSLRAFLNAYEPLQLAATKMDNQIAAFATATRVTQPEGVTWKQGARFPISKQAWEGRMAIWESSGTGGNSSLDTTDIAHRYREAATEFRGAVGDGIRIWKMQDSHNTLVGF